MKGYMGKILLVDLTTQQVESLPLEEELARAYLGGNGLAVRLLHERLSADVEPLSKENVVVFATGPFNESPVWGTGRGHVASLSPLTGLYMDSNFGGNFASMLKRSGFDALVITGEASVPVYLRIIAGNASFRSARDLWGMRTKECRDMLAAREGKGIESAIIGPAGERGVLYAGIMCSGSRQSAAGRGGIGAVLGKKKLKAVVAGGKGAIECADGEGLRAWLKERLPGVRQKAAPLSTMGTPFLVNIINARGMLATRNNSREIFEKVDALSGERIRDHFRRKDVACRGCPVACGKLVNDSTGRPVKMPEYETLYAMGSMLDNADLLSIIDANAMCDEVGIDTISFGVTLAFLMECMERDIVSPQDMDMEIAFGSTSGLAELVRRTGYREGAAGELLALGSERLAQRFGGDAHKFLYTQQGLEMAGHSARGLRNMGLAYATSNRGGSHHDARPNYAGDAEDTGFDGQPEYCVESEHNTALGDSLVMCRFIQERLFGAHLNEAYLYPLRAVTGWDMDLPELKRIAERIYTLERLINVARGATRGTIQLPWRVMHEPIPEGPSAGRHVPQQELSCMLHRYYECRGWDERGIPGEEKLRELDLLKYVRDQSRYPAIQKAAGNRA